MLWCTNRKISEILFRLVSHQSPPLLPSLEHPTRDGAASRVESESFKFFFGQVPPHPPYTDTLSLPFPPLLPRQMPPAPDRPSTGCQPLPHPTSPRASQRITRTCGMSPSKGGAASRGISRHLSASSSAYKVGLAFSCLVR